MRFRVWCIPWMTVLSLAVLIAAITFWTRSRRHVDLVTFMGPAGHLQGLASSHGGLVVFSSGVPFGAESRMTANAASISPDSFSPVFEWLFDDSRLHWHVLGFQFATGKIDLNASTSCNYSATIIPFWCPAIVAAILPLGFFRRGWMRWRRARQGRCLHCGYDISRSTERCPECGTALTTNWQDAGRSSFDPPSRGDRFAAVAAWLVAGLVLAGAVQALVRGSRLASGNAIAAIGDSAAARSTSGLVLRVYPVSDLVNSGAWAPGVSLWARQSPVDPPPSTSADRVIELLRFNRLDDWSDSGGSGYIAMVADRLAVYETRRGHAAVRAMLAVMRTQPPDEQPPATEPDEPTSHINLAQRIAELDIDAPTLEAAVGVLRDKTQANLVVLDSKTPNDEPTPAKRIKLHLWDVTLGQALDIICSMGSGLDDPLAHDVWGDVIRIATATELRRQGKIVTRIYDVRDIIAEVVAYKVAGAAPAPPTSAPTPSPGALLSFSPRETGATLQDEVIETLSRLIEDEVATDSWKDNGGAEGAMREFGGRLVITQTPANHREVVRVLRILRSGGNKEGAPMNP